jgi:putative colanic acid biosynthesis glycosyltransferase
VKLSIITIHLNDFPGLQRTLRSLERVLRNSQVEWIVVDGGSDSEDDAGNVLTQAKSLAAHFVSEPDEGIYDAMNKGTLLASGEFVLYLNAGDELHAGFDIDKSVADPDTADAGMIWGRYDVRDRSDTVYSRKTRRPLWLRYGTAVCHQAVFFRRSLLGTYPYNTDLNIAADYDLICRLYTAGENIRFLDMPVCIFDLVGESGADKRRTLREEAGVRRKHFPVVGVFNVLITGFKLAIWQLGTLVPSFRRAWSRYF